MPPRSGSSGEAEVRELLSRTDSYFSRVSALRVIFCSKSSSPASKNPILVEVDPVFITSILPFITRRKADRHYLADIAAMAMELSLVSILSARLESTQGTLAPTTIPACFTSAASLELHL